MLLSPLGLCQARLRALASNHRGLGRPLMGQRLLYNRAVLTWILNYSMQRRIGLATLSLVMLVGCASAPPTPNPASGQASALSPQAIHKANQASLDYFACIQKELAKYAYQGNDFRYETQALLKRCEDRLEPIRQAFAAEGVDPQLISRYLKRKRTQAARYVLEALMELEARQRAANTGG